MIADKLRAVPFTVLLSAVGVPETEVGDDRFGFFIAADVGGEEGAALTHGKGRIHQCAQDLLSEAHALIPGGHADAAFLKHIGRDLPHPCKADGLVRILQAHEVHVLVF